MKITKNNNVYVFSLVNLRRPGYWYGFQFSYHAATHDNKNIGWYEGLSRYLPFSLLIDASEKIKVVVVVVVPSKYPKAAAQPKHFVFKNTKKTLLVTSSKMRMGLK